MAHGTQLLRPHPNEQLDDVECKHLTNIPYRSLVGSLMYIASGTHPDIAFAVSKLSCFLDCYHEAPWQAAIQVVRYLKDTRMFLLRLGGTSSLLIGYCDSDMLTILVLKVIDPLPDTASLLATGWYPGCLRNKKR